MLQAVFAALFEQGVLLEGMLLKPNMVLSGKDCSRQARVRRWPPRRCAACAVTCRRRSPASSSCRAARATSSRRGTSTPSTAREGPKPWKLSFSYGRALQDAPLATWRGSPKNVEAAQRAFQRRARSNGLAAMGAYPGEEGDEPRWGAAAAAAPPA